MNDDLEILEALFQSKTGAFRVCTAVYKNEPCYCVTHIHDGDQHTVLVEYDKQILKAVIQRLKRRKKNLEADSFSNFIKHPTKPHYPYGHFCGQSTISCH